MAAHGPISLDPNEQRTLGALSKRLFGFGMTLGIIGLVVAGLLILIGGDQALDRVLYAYVANFAFVLSIGIGALLFVMVHMLAKTGTVNSYRRIGENLACTIPHLLPFLLPVLLGGFVIYYWTHIEGDVLVDAKKPWLLYWTWVPRMVLYLVILSAMAWWFRKQSLAQDVSGDPQLTKKMQGMAAPAILIFAAVVTGFAFDLLKTLDPHWFSTIFGVYFFAGGFMAFHALMAIIIIRLQSRDVLTHSVNDEHFHDMGKMMFAFVVFWAYIMFSQYMLQWYGNIPEETVWFIRRGVSTDPAHVNPFTYLSIVLLFGHFFIPFLGMISRWTKRDKAKLHRWAIWLIFMHWLDMIWLVRPELRVSYDKYATLPLNWVDILASIACLVGLGGILLAAFAKVCGSDRSLVAEKDPRLGEALAFENI